jgi:hypothetical protein
MQAAATLVPTADALTLATDATARAILDEIEELTGEARRAQRALLRRALFADRLPLVSMRSGAYLVFHRALLEPARDDFARRCDVVAAVMIARSDSRLTRPLRLALQLAIDGMEPPTRDSARQWLRGQLFDGARARVTLDEPGEVARLVA